MSSKDLKFVASVYFIDQQENKRFLFRVINFGKNTDEIKFSFLPPKTNSGGAYIESPDSFGEGDIHTLYSEITYHSDGTILHKFPVNQKGEKTQYRNPFGTGNHRTPIIDLMLWIYKTDYRGRTMKVGNGDFSFFFQGNIIETVTRNQT